METTAELLANHLSELERRIMTAFENVGRTHYGKDGFDYAIGERRGLLTAYAVITGRDYEEVAEDFRESYINRD